MEATHASWIELNEGNCVVKCGNKEHYGRIDFNLLYLREKRKTG
jgi:hypothetical protein